eukprot:1099773_1
MSDEDQKRTTQYVQDEMMWKLNCFYHADLSAASIDSHTFLLQCDLYLISEIYKQIDSCHCIWDFDKWIRVRLDHDFEVIDIQDSQIEALKHEASHCMHRKISYMDLDWLDLPIHCSKINAVFHCGDVIILFDKSNGIWCSDLAYNVFVSPAAQVQWWRSHRDCPDLLSSAAYLVMQQWHLLWHFF